MKTAQKEIQRACDSACEALHRVVTAIRRLDPQPVAARATDLASVVIRDIESADCSLTIGVWIPAGLDVKKAATLMLRTCGALFPSMKPRNLPKAGGAVAFDVADPRGQFNCVIAPIRVDDHSQPPLGFSPLDAWFDVVVVEPEYASRCHEWLGGFDFLLKPDSQILPDPAVEDGAPPRPFISPLHRFASTIARRADRRLAWVHSMCWAVESFLAREQSSLAALTLQLDVRLSNLRDMRKKANLEKTLAFQRSSLALETTAVAAAAAIEVQFASHFELTNLRLDELRKEVSLVVTAERLQEKPKDADVPRRFELAPQLFGVLQKDLVTRVDNAWFETGGMDERVKKSPLSNAIVALAKIQRDAIEDFSGAHRRVLPHGALPVGNGKAISLSTQIKSDAKALHERLQACMNLALPAAKAYEGHTFFSIVGAIRAGVMQWTMPFSFLIGAVVGAIALVGESNNGSWAKWVLILVSILGVSMTCANLYRHRNLTRIRFSREYSRELEDQVSRSFERARASIRGTLAKILMVLVKDMSRGLREGLDRVTREIDLAVSDRERLLQHRREMAVDDEKQFSELLKSIEKNRVQLEELCKQNGHARQVIA